jgi:hypothetical protein
MTNREKIAAVWKPTLFSYLEFKYSRSTIMGFYLMVFMRQAQLHIQSLDCNEISTMGGNDEAVYSFYENSN